MRRPMDLVGVEEPDEQHRQRDQDQHHGEDDPAAAHEPILRLAHLDPRKIQLGRGRSTRARSDQRQRHRHRLIAVKLLRKFRNIKRKRFPDVVRKLSASDVAAQLAVRASVQRDHHLRRGMPLGEQNRHQHDELLSIPQL